MRPSLLERLRSRERLRGSRGIFDVELLNLSSEQVFGRVLDGVLCELRKWEYLVGRFSFPNAVCVRQGILFRSDQLRAVHRWDLDNNNWGNLGRPVYRLVFPDECY